jgi:outer membrane protein insertion porin family
VDINLKVKEKGKNSIGLNGGVSGLSGAFVGLNYQTNNFLGLGETLTLSASLGTFQRDAMFGFTEPYFLDKPIQLGFTVFTRNFKYNQAKQASISTGVKSTLPTAFLGSLQNYSQQSTGFTVSTSYPLHRSFKRVGLTYSFDTSTITPYTEASSQYFEYLAFRNVGGPNALQGIQTSKLVPSFSSSTIDNPMRPHSGRSYFFGMDIAGLGGNVADIRPIAEYKQFIPMKGIHPRKEGLQTFGFRLQGSFITGFAGKTAPPFERFFQGGDTDLRGFDVRAAGPVALISDSQIVTLINGAPWDPNNPRNPCGALAGQVCPYTIKVPVTRLVYPGGDTSIVSNLEYRIPIVGPVTFAFFADTGMNMAVRQSQLRLSDQQVSNLDNTAFGCPAPNASYTACQPSGNGFVGTQYLKFDQNLTPVAHTNYAVRMSTGAELQVILPVVNAPFRIFYAYNPLRVDTHALAPNRLTRDMFPDGAAGENTYLSTIAQYNPSYRILEPRKTFRFTVATTF